MDDDFESQYADDLEALEDLDYPDDCPPKPKRTLTFSSPSHKLNGSKKSSADLNESLTLTPLETCEKLLDAALWDQKKKTVVGLVRPEKRTRNSIIEELGGDSNVADIQSPLHKKAKRNCGSDGKFLNGDLEDITPPPSPDDIDRILQYRNRKLGNHIPTREDHSEPHPSLENYDFERKRVYTQLPKGQYMSVTSTDGNRVYMTMKEEIDLDQEYEAVTKNMKKVQLLTTSISALRAQLEDERHQRLIAESEQITAKINREIDKDLHLDEELDHEETVEPIMNAERLLWVEKYAPQKYTDLLSEESINRTLLHWLKLWDFVVFGKERKVKNKDKQKEKETKTFKKKNIPEVSDELDKHNRPLQRVSLLCGPPGLGKTTLAHVIASHAGYNVVEMNASDDRSAEIFKNKLEAATQMKAVLGADPRPNCLIIDEIDGAPQAAINILLNLLRRSDEPLPGKKKKNEGGVLLRPIICICNDQYVPALRQLRQMALVMNFPSTEASKLASRLYEVVRLEGLKSDLNALLALCEKTDNDIRSCLNTLQFIQRKCKEVTLRIVQAMSTGMKDSHKSLFSVWHEIFSIPRQKRNRFVDIRDVIEQGNLHVNNTSTSARFQNILDVAYSCGEYEKMMQGLFENYLECKFKDPRLHGLCLASDWLCFVDHVNQYIGHSQDYSPMAFIPYIAVTFHFLFASTMPQKIQFPQKAYEAQTKQSKSSNLVVSMMSDMLPSVRKFLNETMTVMEVLPPLMSIIQPTLRPVNTQLYSAREKENLAQLIHIMIAYNMTYHQEKSLEGQYSYVIDPNVDEIVRFPEMKQHRQLTYGAKQLIAREIELEKMRRSEAFRTGSSSTRSVTQPTKELKEMPAIPNHKQKLQAKALDPQPERPVKDFFGRVVRRKSPERKEKKEPEKINILDTDIWFHFKEGFSNAVRRNVRVKDFQ